MTHPKKLSLVLFAALTLSACASLQPNPLDEHSLATQGQADKLASQRDVEALSGELTLDEAIARALKYNLDRRAKMMEEALAFRQLDVSRLDMLPRLLAQAAYNSRNNDKISQSRNTDSGELSPSRFVSQDRDHATSSLGHAALPLGGGQSRPAVDRTGQARAGASAGGLRQPRNRTGGNVSWPLGRLP